MINTDNNENKDNQIDIEKINKEKKCREVIGKKGKIFEIKKSKKFFG